MTVDNDLKTLRKTACIGLLGGLAFGLWVLICARLGVHPLHPLSHAPDSCSAGFVALFAAVFGAQAGTLFGLTLGAIFLQRKRAAELRRLP
ncbi:MAG TPA: hypothetical protein VIP46_10550 [Pyrinomonadaceae bacterium]